MQEIKIMVKYYPASSPSQPRHFHHSQVLRSRLQILFPEFSTHTPPLPTCYNPAQRARSGERLPTGWLNELLEKAGAGQQTTHLVGTSGHTWDVDRALRKQIKIYDITDDAPDIFFFLAS